LYPEGGSATFRCAAASSFLEAAAYRRGPAASRRGHVKLGLELHEKKANSISNRSRCNSQSFLKFKTGSTGPGAEILKSFPIHYRG
jgi:hypothetical protein